jgi:hypothetical protein
MTTRMGWVTIAVAAAAALSGCGIDKADENGRQLDVIGDVQIRTTLCTSGDLDQDARACAIYSRAHRGQVLVAYRIPDGSQAPDSFSDDRGTLHFARSDSYGQYMEQTYPEPGMHWTGFASQPHTVNAGSQGAVTLSPRLTLPGAGKLFAGPYRYYVAGGYRGLAGPADDGSAAISCTDTVTFCASTGPPGADSAQPTRDLAVLPAAADVPTAVPGGEVSVPFDLRFAGSAGDEVHFGLAATSDLGGARLAPGRETLVPGADSGNPVAVRVSVPAGAREGTYAVKLTATAVGEPDVIIRKPVAGAARVPGTEERTGTTTFRVVAPPREEPPVSDEPPAPVPPVEAPTPTPPVGVPPAVAPPAIAPPAVADAPAGSRAKLRLSLSASPRRAYQGAYATYLLVARNTSHEPAVRARVCETLPSTVQFVRASRRVHFAGRSVCFGRRHVSGGASLAALVYVHVDTDARAGMSRAWATAVAANADRARARAGLRVLRRAPAPRHAPVTG